MIKDFINEIAVTTDFSVEQGKDIVKILIIGDGVGDHQKYENTYTPEVLEGYIKYCAKQSEIAAKLLDDIRQKNGEHIVSEWKEILSK